MKSGQGLVIYDGSCGLCAGNLHWLRRLDWLHKFSDIPYQDPRLKELWPQADLEVCEQALHLLLPGGKVYRGADAFREVFLRLPLALPLGLLMAIPPLAWLSRKIYPYIAQNRHFLGGRCPLPKPQKIPKRRKSSPRRG